MKKWVQSLLQSLLGFQRYLFVFSLFKVRTLYWDKKEGDFLYFLSLIPENGVVLDIGANIGIMVVHLAKRCKSGRVHAFEPIPENFRTLTKICKYFNLDNVVLHNLALGAEEGELTMVMPRVSSVKMQGLSHVVHESITEFNEGDLYTVPQVTLDTLSALQDEKVAAIKIDVENFEQFVFRGGLNLLRKNKPLVYCELWENENREACFQLFERELAYTIQVLINGKLEVYDRQKHDRQNFFFVP